MVNNCATERVIYKTQYVKAPFLPLLVYPRPKKDKECSYNIDNLTNLVESYENEINIFNSLLEEYHKE